MKKLIILCIVSGLLVTACGRRDEAEAEPASENVAQGVVTPTLEESSATPTPLPTPKLRTEIAESPVQQPIADSQASSPVPPPSNSDAVSPLPGSDELVAKAKVMLTEVPGIRATADEISLLSMTSRDWPDGSLGCPKEGQMYIQVITPGYIIVLESNGETYEFHTNMQDQVEPCFEAE